MSEQHAHPVHHHRGFWLTAFLVVAILLNLARSYVIYQLMQLNQLAIAAWVLPALLAVSLGGLIGAIGMWLWKRWGLTLYTAATLLSIAVSLVLTGVLLVAFYDVIPLLVLGFMIRGRQDLFT